MKYISKKDLIEELKKDLGKDIAYFKGKLDLDLERAKTRKQALDAEAQCYGDMHYFNIMLFENPEQYESLHPRRQAVREEVWHSQPAGHRANII